MNLKSPILTLLIISPKLLTDETGLANPFAAGSGVGNEINDVVVEKQNDAILLV